MSMKLKHFLVGVFQKPFPVVSVSFIYRFENLSPKRKSGRTPLCSSGIYPDFDEDREHLPPYPSIKYRQHLNGGKSWSGFHEGI